MATPKKQSRVASIDSDSGSPTDYLSASEQNDGEQEDNSPSISDRDSSQDDSSDNSGAEPETSQDDSQINSWNSCQHGRDSPEDSQESDTESSPSPSIDTHKKFNKSRGDERKDKSQGYKKDSFVPDKAPKQERMAAHGRLKKAFTHVTEETMEMHKSQKNRATETLYVGNLAFNTTDKDLSKALHYHFGNVIVVEKITIPCINGKSKYGFIELSWPRSTMKDTADLMTLHSGVIPVHGRRIYFRELRDKGNKR